MYNSRPATVGILALSLLIGVGGVVSHARKGEDPTGGSDIGMVDIEKIYEASDAPQQFAQTAAQIEADAQTRIDAIGAVPQLTEAELKEYGDLVGLRSPDAKQKVRMDELKDFSDKRAAHLRDVQMKADAVLTPEDRKLMASSAQQRRLFDRVMGMVQADVRQQVAEREDIVKRDLVGKLRGEVSKIAHEKKILHVFDSTAMVSSTNDLTQAVIQKIGRKANK